MYFNSERFNKDKVYKRSLLFRITRKKEYAYHGKRN